MTEHERVIAAAKAGIARANELALPPEAPELGLRHEIDSHVARLERTIAGEKDARLAEAKESRALRAAVAGLLRTVKVLVPATLVFVMVFAAASLVAFDRISTQAQTTERVAKENRRLGLENARTQRAAAVAVKKTAEQARVVIRETCQRQNRDRGKLRAIIERGEASIPKLVAEGTLTQAQADRSLRDSRRARRELHDDRCAKRAARIPIPAVP